MDRKRTVDADSSSWGSVGAAVPRSRALASRKPVKLAIGVIQFLKLCFWLARHPAPKVVAPEVGFRPYAGDHNGYWTKGGDA